METKTKVTDRSATPKEKVITVIIAVILLAGIFICITANRGISAALSIFLVGLTITTIIVIMLCVVFEIPPYSKRK